MRATWTLLDVLNDSRRYGPIIQSYNDKDSTYCFQAAMCQMMKQALSVFMDTSSCPSSSLLSFIL